MTKQSRAFWLVILCAVVGGAGLLLSRFWALPLGAGAVLLAWSWFAPQKTGLMIAGREDNGGSGMILPAIWNEKEVGLGLTRYQNNPGMLSSYVNGIVSRFVVGQDTRTMQARIAFLEQFNKFGEVARESYKWQRLMSGGRAKTEEDAEDAKAEFALRQVQSELELGALDTDIKRHEKRLQIERLKRELEELNKPAPPPPVHLPQPSAPSASQAREERLQEVNEQEKRILEEMRLTRANPTLDEDQKQRKLNALEDRLAQIHDEQAKLI
jgi:hypothetical protein